MLAAVIAGVRFRTARKSYHRRYYEEILPAYLIYIDREREIELSRMSDKEVLRKTLEWMDYYLNEAFWPHMESELFVYTQSVVARNFELIFGPRGDEMMTRLLRGLDGNVNVETNIDLWRFSQEEITLEEFLQKYGHRAGFEIELANARWREAPDFVLKMAGALRHSRGVNPIKRFEVQRRDRLEAKKELRKALRRTFLKRAFSPWRWHIMREVDFLQLYFPLRETSKINALMAGELVRKGLLELGRRSGLGEDIFYLVPSELELLVKGEDFILQVEERRRRRELMLKVEVPIIVYSDRLDEVGNPPPPRSTRVLEGLSVSTGVAEGTARLILDPGEAEALEEGQIMVAPATDPAWSPLFLRAAGLVMDTGGVLSHGSIIAREYGIPAVVDVGDATRVIKDGQRIRVDAKAGKVYILDAIS
jgi:pyruvate,water dikinase